MQTTAVISTQPVDRWSWDFSLYLLLCKSTA